MSDFQRTQLKRFVRKNTPFKRLVRNTTPSLKRCVRKSTPLKRCVRMLQLEKFVLLRNPKLRRILRLNSEIRRMRRRLTVIYTEDAYSTIKPSPYSNVLVPRTCYQYQPTGELYKYGIVFWLRRGDENDKENDVHEDSENEETYMVYKVTIKFMCGFRNGLFIQLSSKPWDIPFYFATNYKIQNSKDHTNNCIPIGLAALLVGLGIPDTCREAMFRDISRFAPPHPAAACCSVVTLCMEIQITTLQLEGEDVLEIHLCADVDRIRRSEYIDLILLNEANLEHCSMKQFLEDQQVEDCCSFCLEELGGVECCELPCSHIYHNDCIFKWMSQYNFCPLCRHPYQRLFHPCSLSHETPDTRDRRIALRNRNGS